MKTLLTAGLAATLIAATCLMAAQSESDVSRELKNLIGHNTYLACGLDKLDEQEQAELIACVSSVPLYSFLESSALNYLTEQGWKHIEVVGYRDVYAHGSSSADEYLVARFEGRVLLLDPLIGADRLDPGTYWVKADGSIRWEILGPSGRIVDVDPQTD